jgi:hypothetical protein
MNNILHSIHQAPIQQLPRFMRDLTYCVANQLNVDPGMALSTLVSGMATAVHGTKSVVRPDGGTEPLSLLSVIVAAPTTGKTRTYRLTHQVHLEEDLRRYETLLNTQANASGSRPASDGRSGPDHTRWVSLQNATNRALVEALKGIGESTSISSDEGQTILHSDLFRRHLDTPNTLYDGNKVMLNRARGQSLVAADASLVVLVMAQPDIFDAYCCKYGEYARGVGFFARVLFTVVPPSRPSSPVAHCGSGAPLDEYHDLVGKLLRDQLERAGKPRRKRDELEFSPEASTLYFELAREHALYTQSHYWHIEDAANRALQNAVRLAAIMHVFSGEDGPIPPATLEGAYEMVRWHLSQFATLFPPKPWPVPAPPKLTPQERAHQRLWQRVADDRQAILDIICDLCRSRHTSSALKSDVRTLFRERAYDARFRAALLRLTNDGTVIETLAGKDALLSVAPALASPGVIWPNRPGCL